jgi:pimeloyl-ACP methyl ester carboxylesterase
VKALVYVAGLAPDKGENIPDLATKYPGATLGDAAVGVPQPDGTTDFYIDQSKYHEYFGADLRPEQAALAPADLRPEQAALAPAGQRPLNSAAFEEPSGEPAWKTIPSWFIYAEFDRAFPIPLSRFMAERANAQETVEVPGASCALPASQPQVVADFILRAAASV